MTLQNDFLTAVRSDVLAYLVANVARGHVGTDGTAPTAADGGLLAQVFEDSFDDTDTSQVDSRTFTLQIGSGEANGNTILEGGAELSDNTSVIRNLINSINKTSDIQLWLAVKLTVEVTEGS